VLRQLPRPWRQCSKGGYEIADELLYAGLMSSRMTRTDSMSWPAGVGPLPTSSPLRSESRRSGPSPRTDPSDEIGELVFGAAEVVIRPL
jgi:hypothetical protein